MSVWLTDQRRLLRRLGFEADFYLRQLRPRRRALAARDPELHYLLIGWRENFSPSRRCDQVFVSANRPEMAGNPYLGLDPSRGPRNDLEALGRGQIPAPTPNGYALILHHARGGGSTKCLALFERRLEQEGYAPLRLRLVARSDRLVVLQSSTGLQVFDLIDDLAAFLASMSDLPIRRVVVSHVVDFEPTRIFAVVARIVAHFSCPLDLVIHDYLAVCARINLVDHEEKTCFEPAALDRCRACIAAGGSEVGRVDPGVWRSDFVDLAASADRVIALSEDMRSRLAPFLPGPIAIWHPEEDVFVEESIPIIDDDESLRIAVLGALNVAKGSKVIAALGRAAKARNAPLVLDVIGTSPQARLLEAAGVAVHGRYRDSAVADILKDRRPHVAFIPAIWPETWSFVLTHLLASGLPVFVFAHGAQAERLRAIGRSDYLIDYRTTEDVDRLLNIFLDFRLRCLARRRGAGGPFEPSWAKTSA